MSLLFIMVFIFNAREPEKPVYINRENKGTILLFK